MSRKAWVGAAFLTVVVAGVAVLVGRTPGAGTLTVRLLDHVTGHTDHLRVTFAEVPPLRVGDPVYSVEGQAFALQGRVASINTGSLTEVVIAVDPSVCRRFHDGTTAVAMKPGGDLAWVLRTLVPPDLRTQVLDELATVWEEHKKEALDSLKPHLIALAGDLTGLLRDTLPAALEDCRAEREAFFQTFTQAIFPQELAPVLKTQVLARLESRLSGMAADLGAEIWNNVSFGDIAAVLWTSTKTKVGLGADQDLTARLSQLLEKKALPVFRRRSQEILDVALETAGEAAQDPSVRKAIDATALRTLEQPSFQSFVGHVLERWLIHNPKLRERLASAVHSEGVREPLRRLWKAAEPVLETALQEMLTRPDRAGMDHQLVRVLRNVVLKKDRRYLVLKDGGRGALDPDGVLIPGTIGIDP